MRTSTAGSSQGADYSLWGQRSRESRKRAMTVEEVEKCRAGERQSLRGDQRRSHAKPSDVPGDDRVCLDARTERMNAHVGEHPVAHLGDEEHQENGIAET